MEQRAAERTDVGEVVVVRLGASRYALPLAVVSEVGRPPGLTRVPGLPAWLPGVANWRGRVLPVADLRPLLGTPDAPLGRGARLVVLTVGGVRVGVLADAVEGTTALAPGTVEPAPAHLPAAARALLAGQVTDAAGPVGLLDTAGLLALGRSLPRPRRG